MSPKVDPWIRLFDVGETKLHPKGYTIYRITSTVFPRNYPEAATEVIVWKRFSEIKKLYKSLHSLHSALHLKGDFPNFPRDKIFGRFEPDVVEERRRSALNLLEFVAGYPPLFTSQVFLKFFEGVRTSPQISKEDVAVEQDKSPLNPVKVNHCTPSADQTNVHGEEPLLQLGGVWQYPQPSDNVSLDSGDDSDGVSPKEEECDSFASSNHVLALFDPLAPPRTGEEGNASSFHDNSWLFSALASCSDFRETDSECALQPPLAFPEAFGDFSEENTVTRQCSLDELDARESYEKRLSSSDAVIKSDGDHRLSSAVCNSKPAIVKKTGIDHPLDAAFAGDGLLSLNAFENEPVIEYLVEAAQILKSANESEANGDYEKAFEQYKVAVEILLCGVQEDLEANRRVAVRRKIESCLQRAEEIYTIRMSGNDRDNDHMTVLQSGMTKHLLWNLSSPKSSLGRYKVLGLLSKVLLVLDSLTNQTYVIKVLSKASRPLCPLAPYIVPPNSAHMVQLLRFHETEDSVFLVLEHAVGGKLWNFVGSYLLEESAGGHCARKDSSSESHLEDSNIYAGKRLCGDKGNSKSAEFKGAEVADPPVPPQESANSDDCCSSYFDLVTNYVASSPTEGRVPLAQCKLTSPGHRPSVSDLPEIEGSDERTGDQRDVYEGCTAWSTVEEEQSSWINLDNVDPKDLISNAQKLMEHVEETLRESNRVISMLEGSSPRSSPKITVPDREQSSTSGEAARRKSLPSPSGLQPSRRSSDAPGSRRLHASKDAFASSQPQHVPSQDLRLHTRRGSGGSLELKRNRIRHFSAVFRQMDECNRHSPSLPESCIRVWAAEIVAAVASLHAVGLVCRDLKPDNVLLGERGHVLLSYFSQWPSVNATVDPEARELLYTAPEIGGIFTVTPVCDWWSVGALLFELFTGKTFASLHPGGFTRHTSLQIPCALSNEANSLLRGLLCYYPNERLGGGLNGDDSVKMHPFFQGFDWNKI